MDPLSIVASAVAIGQAGDRLIYLASKIRQFFNAPLETDALLQELSDLKIVLGAIKGVGLQVPQESIPSFWEILTRFKAVVHQLENILSEIFDGLPIENIPLRRLRFRWLKRRSKVESLRQRLRDIKSTLTLQMVGVNSEIFLGHLNAVYSTRRTSSEPEAFARSNIRGDVEYPDCQTEEENPKRLIGSRIHHEGVQRLQNLSLHDRNSFTSALRSQERLNFGIDSVAKHSALERVSATSCRNPPNRTEGSLNVQVTSTEQASRTNMLAAPSFEDVMCSTTCSCRCHHRYSRHQGLFNEVLGSLHISGVGDPFASEICDQQSCIRRSAARLLIVYYFPKWLSRVGVSLRLSNNGRPHVALSFPRIMPPDFEFFRCIRTGDCDRIMKLLSNGEASVADIVAPYGMTTLTLAISYNQLDVCRLLLQEGACELALDNSWIIGDVQAYFGYFSPFECYLSFGEVVDDLVRLQSPDGQVNAQLNCIAGRRSEDSSFTRLHKSVLGLTTETVGSIGPLSRESINETDSLGRTALHWAAYMNDAKVIDQLLRCGADPDIGDRTGKTPLHIAASSTFPGCIRALAAGGANLESRDRMGMTPMHFAASQGHGSVIEALLDEGADAKAKNDNEEQPMAFAIYGRKVEAIKVLVNHGIEFDYRDHWGYFPMADCALFNSHDVLHLLLQQTTQAAFALHDGKTLLHIAAMHSDLTTIEMLQNSEISGLDVAAIDEAGHTAMEYLQKRRDAADLIEPFGALLLSIGGNPCERQGETSYSVEPSCTGRMAERGKEAFVDAVEFQPEF